LKTSIYQRKSTRRKSEMMENFWSALNQVGSVMPVIGMFVGLAAAIIIFFWFMSKKNEGRFTGLPGWLYEFFQFRNYIVEVVLKFTYVIAACTLTGIGIFSIISLQLPMGLGFLLVGNLLIRIIYELLLMMIVTVRNVSQINKKMNDIDTKKMETFEFKKPPLPKMEDFIVPAKVEVIEQESQTVNEQMETDKGCLECGKQLQEGDCFCSQCGKKV